MLYALYFFSSVVLSFFTVRLTGKVLGYEVTKNRFLFWFCMAAIAGDSLLLTLPAELFYLLGHDLNHIRVKVHPVFHDRNKDMVAGRIKLV